MSGTARRHCRWSSFQDKGPSHKLTGYYDASINVPSERHEALGPVERPNNKPSSFAQTQSTKPKNRRSRRNASKVMSHAQSRFTPLHKIGFHVAITPTFDERLAAAATVLRPCETGASQLGRYRPIVWRTTLGTSVGYAWSITLPCIQFGSFQDAFVQDGHPRQGPLQCGTSHCTRPWRVGTQPSVSWRM